jgi:hypothetical protein
MPEDPIVAEVRRARNEISRECGDDLRTIFDYFKKRERDGGREVVSRPCKRVGNKDA